MSPLAIQSGSGGLGLPELSFGPAPTAPVLEKENAGLSLRFNLVQSNAC